MPVAAVVPTPTPPGFDQAPVGSGPWRFVPGSTTMPSCSPGTTAYWGGAPLEDTLRIRIIPEALTQAPSTRPAA